MPEIISVQNLKRAGIGRNIPHPRGHQSQLSFQNEGRGSSLIPPISESNKESIYGSVADKSVDYEKRFKFNDSSVNSTHQSPTKTTRKL
jgi:hypothetical protein